MSINKVVHSLSFFDVFTPEDLAILIPFIEIRDFSKGELIVDQSVVNTSLYFLLEGSVGVYVNKCLVSIESDYGDVYGEMSLSGRRCSYAKIISQKDSRFLVFNFLALHEIRGQRRDHLEKLVFKSFSEVLANRLDKANLTISKLKNPS